MMIKLSEYADPIEDFLVKGIRSYISANEKPRSIGIYCCPWSGWISLNFDRIQEFPEVENCPDYTDPEHDILDFREWSEEYEKSDVPSILTPMGETLEIDVEDAGDEAFNRPFFDFLEAMVDRLFSERSFDGAKVVHLQFLDSELSRTWRNT